MIPTNSEEIAVQLLEALRADLRTGTTQAGADLRVRSSLERWTREHTAAAQAALATAFDAADPLGGPFAAPLRALADLISAGGTSKGDPDAWLMKFPGRVSASADDIRFGALTPVTDLDGLLAGLLGRVPARPRHRPSTPEIPPTFGVRLDPVELAEYLGISVRQLDELWRARPQPSDVRAVLDGLTARLGQDDPLLGSILSEVLRTEPNALAETPFMRVLLAVLRGVRPPGKRANVELVHLVELEGICQIALVVVPPSARKDPRIRSELAAHMRYVSERLVAPWNRWRRHAERREALTLYARTAAGLRPDVELVMQQLRERYPDVYANERRDITTRRLYRISAEIRRAVIPASVRKNARRIAHHGLAAD